MLQAIFLNTTHTSHDTDTPSVKKPAPWDGFSPKGGWRAMERDDAPKWHSKKHCPMPLSSQLGLMLRVVASWRGSQGKIWWGLSKPIWLNTARCMKIGKQAAHQQSQPQRSKTEKPIDTNK